MSIQLFKAKYEVEEEEKALSHSVETIKGIVSQLSL